MTSCSFTVELSSSQPPDENDPLREGVSYEDVDENVAERPKKRHRKRHRCPTCVLLVRELREPNSEPHSQFSTFIQDEIYVKQHVCTVSLEIFMCLLRRASYPLKSPRPRSCRGLIARLPLLHPLHNR